MFAWSEIYRKTHQVWQPASATIQQLKGDVVFVVWLTIDLSVASISSFLSGVLSGSASAILVKLFFFKCSTEFPLQEACFSIRAPAYHWCVFFTLRTFVSLSSTQIFSIDLPPSVHSSSTPFIKDCIVSKYLYMFRSLSNMIFGLQRLCQLFSTRSSYFFESLLVETTAQSPKACLFKGSVFCSMHHIMYRKYVQMSKIPDFCWLPPAGCVTYGSWPHRLRQMWLIHYQHRPSYMHLSFGKHYNNPGVPRDMNNNK